jgi:hypothetical protein
MEGIPHLRHRVWKLERRVRDLQNNLSYLISVIQIVSNNSFLSVQSYTQVIAGDFHLYRTLLVWEDLNGEAGVWVQGVSGYPVDYVNQMADAVGTQFKRLRTT